MPWVFFLALLLLAVLGCFVRGMLFFLPCLVGFALGVIACRIADEQ